MLKVTALAIVCLTAMPVALPTPAMADYSNSHLSAVERRSDLLYARIVRSPESIERERLNRRRRLHRPGLHHPRSGAEWRRREAYRQQVEWRRRHGDLSPRRHRR